MCRQTDRHAPCIPGTRFLTAAQKARLHVHAHKHGYPTVASLRDNSRQIRFPSLHPGAGVTLLFPVSMSLCWQDVGTALIVPGLQVVLTESSQKAERFKFATSCFWKLIGWWILLCRMGTLLISKVKKKKRGKWILMKTHMQKQNVRIGGSNWV